MLSFNRPDKSGFVNSLAFVFIVSLTLTVDYIVLAQGDDKNIVINEIMYHPPSDLEGEEFIELYNTGKTPVDLSGWKFTKGIRYTFPQGTIIEPDGYLVVCRALDEFRAAYGEDIIAVGNFKRKLSNRGEQVVLSDNTGRTIDSVKYADRLPWPVGADGYSSSLERICPKASGEASNWAPSPLPMNERQPTGTPGRRNANYSEELPPVISEIEFYPQNPKPNQPVAVRAKVTDKNVASGLCPRPKVILLYRVAKSGYEGEEVELPMEPYSEGGESGLYKAIIPGQPARSIIRFRIKAVGDSGAVRFQPNQHEPRPAYSCFVYENAESATIPMCFIINVDEELYQTARRNEGQRRRRIAMEMFRRDTALESAWFYHTFEQNLNAEQTLSLREIYREKSDAREKMIVDVIESQNLSEYLKSFPDKVKVFNEDLLEATKTVLTEKQNAAFVNWYRQNSLAAATRGLRRGPEQFLRRLINFETPWFFQTVILGLSESQFEKLKSIYQEALKERQEIINLAARDGRGFEIFDRIMELRRSISEKLETVLTNEQQEEFRQWMEENSDFGMGRPGPPGPPRRRPTEAREDRPGFEPPLRRRPAEGNPPSRMRRPGSEPPRQRPEDKNRPFRMGRPGPKPSPPPRGKSAFVYVSPDTRTYQIYDYINVTPRTGGYKVRFHKDQLLNGMKIINLLFEYMPRFALAEHLSYELYKRAGVPAEHSEFIRLSIDDSLLGYHLLIEQPNRNFLRGHKRDDDGNLYKILWYEEGVVAQHEKKTNSHTGHDDVVSLVSALNNTKGEEQWNFIKRHFNVQEVINYFAVSMCLSNWDGFWNNYFTYHDINGNGKWEIYPWDEDKTWGFYDEKPLANDLYDMPLTFGMDEELLPGEERGPKGGPNWRRPGKPSWWRPAGYFSGPLLANPHFRKLFLIRLKEITETMFTEAIFFPIINEMEKRLEPEVRIRAEANGQDVDIAMKTFHDDIKSLRQFLIKRREFILESNFQ